MSGSLKRIARKVLRGLYGQSGRDVSRVLAKAEQRRREREVAREHARFIEREMTERILANGLEAGKTWLEEVARLWGDDNEHEGDERHER